MNHPIASTPFEEDMKYLNDHFADFNFKNKKSENDKYNKIREKIINLFLEYFEKGIPKENQCYELFENFKHSFTQYGVVQIFGHEMKGCRKNSFDFILDCWMTDQRVRIFIEFKHNAIKLTDPPQLLQIYTNNNGTKITKNDYHLFYYEKYLPKVLDFIQNKYNVTLSLPSYEEYLKDLTNDKKKESFHHTLKKYYEMGKKEMNEIVKESIQEFLKFQDQEGEESFKIHSFHQKLKEQTIKWFLLHKEGKFYFDQISDDQVNIQKFKEIKNDNTIIFETLSKYEIHCLLRWKNGNGCIGPAWQIKLVDPKPNVEVPNHLIPLCREKLQMSMGKRKGYSLVELKEFCKLRNFDTKGKKKDLVSRLMC
jgi:hypothetical protein